MSFVVQNGVPPTCPPHRAPRRKRHVGAAIAFSFIVFAFIVVACSGDNGKGISEQGEPSEQAQPICNQDEGCEPPPRDPCGHDGEACCRINNSCQAGLVCFQGSCTTCGVPAGPCCAGNVCQSGSACQSGACVRTCGAQGLQCCTSGPPCDGGLACSGGSCQLCGRGNQVCCPGNTCNSGFQCTNGTCRACGSNGQACCASGAACGGGLGCVSGTCQPICGYAFGPCCPGVDWQKCQLAGSQFACNQSTNRCESCGNSGSPCCVSGQACTFSNVCGPNPFGPGNACQHCGRNGEPCCSGNSCNSGTVCGSSGRCANCGTRFQPCCSGASCQSGLVCQAGSCQ